MRALGRSLFMLVLVIWALLVAGGAMNGMAAMPAAGIGQIYIAVRGAIVRMNDLTGTGLAVLGPTGTWIKTFEACPRPPECAGVTGYEYGAAGIFVDDVHQVYVTDSVQNRIIRIGAAVTSLGTNGHGVGQFNQPDGIFVDATSRVYVVDSSNNRIVRMNDMTGTGWTALGIQGRGVSQYDAPTGISLDKAGRIYVADSGNRRIVRMNDMTGTGWTTLGTEGEGINQFGSLSGISVDGAGRIYIADSGNRPDCTDE